MSTFDTKMDHENGTISDGEALCAYAHYLAIWSEDAKNCESFQELTFLLRKMFPNACQVLDIQGLGFKDSLGRPQP